MSEKKRERERERERERKNIYLPRGLGIHFVTCLIQKSLGHPQGLTCVTSVWRSRTSKLGWYSGIVSLSSCFEEGMNVFSKRYDNLGCSISVCFPESVEIELRETYIPMFENSLLITWCISDKKTCYRPYHPAYADSDET